VVHKQRTLEFEKLCTSIDHSLSLGSTQSGRLEHLSVTPALGIQRIHFYHKGRTGLQSPHIEHWTRTGHIPDHSVGLKV